MPYTPENNPYIPGDPYSYDLKWVVSEIKHALELYVPLHDEFTELSGDFTELHDYVMNYFAQLDLTQEVSDKLDQMAADGSLEALLRPLVNEIRAEFDAQIATQNAAIAAQNAAITAQDQDISVLEARMDAFSSLAEGSTTGDAELQDIRVDTFGRTWGTAGDAVRGADDILHTSILDISFISTVDSPNHWSIGGINADMTGATNQANRARIAFAWNRYIPAGDLVYIDFGATAYMGRVAVYNTVSQTSLSEVLADPASEGSGILIFPARTHGKMFNISLQHRADASQAFTAEEVAALGSIIKFTVVNLKSRISALDDDVNELAEHDKDILKNIYKYPATLDEFGLNFSKNAFITSSTGAYQNNSAYPYVFGSQTFIKVSELNRFAVQITDPDVYAQPFYYTDALSSAYIGQGAAIHNGDLFIADGNFNGQEYIWMRFNLVSATQGTTDEDYEQCKAAFAIYKSNEYYPRYYMTEQEQRFTVRVNLKWNDSNETSDTTDLTGDYNDINAIIKLPPQYDPAGAPVPLIMFCHGAGSVINDSTWYTGSANFYSFLNTFALAGYAIFDVSNTRNRVGGFPDWGCMPLMSAYIKAWDYIKKHYNVEHDLYLLSDSMGTAAALNMIRWYPGAIKASIQTAPRPICEIRYDTLTGDDKARMAEAFDLVNGAWDNDRLSGFNHVENVMNLDGTDYLNIQTPPIKAMVGAADSSFLTETRKYYAALVHAGNYIDYREVTGATHGDMTFLTPGNLRQEALAFFERFRNS